jgi:hypothetical protein
MSIRNAFVTMALALLAAGIAAEAGAQQRKEGPCAADGKKFCANVPPGQGRIYKCMMSHQAELTPACQDGMRALKEKFERLANACKSDWEKYCKAIPAGDGRILSCLKGRESDLDRACAAEFKRAGSDGAMGR